MTISNAMTKSLLPLLVAFLGVPGFARGPSQAQGSRPGMEKLAVYVGQWHYEEEDAPGPSRPATKVTGDAVGQMIFGGWFFEWRFNEQPEHQGLEIVRYDPAGKRYVSQLYGSSGNCSTGEYVFEGNKTSSVLKVMSAGGKQHLVRVVEVFAPDWRSFDQRAEVSDDGKTWTPAWTAKYTRTDVKR